MRRRNQGIFFEGEGRTASDTPKMRDALLLTGWRCCVLLMILTCALLGLALSYRAIAEMLAGAWNDSATFLAVSLFAGVGVKWLCDHRTELVEM